MTNGQPEPLLEVVALHPSDAERAQEGGASRLHVAALVDGDLMSPEPALVSSVVRACDLPVRVTLRLSQGYTTSGAELARLRGLAADYLALGAEGFVYGFLTRDLEVDVDVCVAVAEAALSAPWTFDRSFDAALDARRGWRCLAALPALDGVLTGGAALGMDTGFDDLVALAGERPAFAAAAIAAGGVRPEHVPWLVRAGVRRFHLESSVRAGGSWRAYVDAAFVRSWRLLLDDEAVERPAGGRFAG